MDTVDKGFWDYVQKWRQAFPEERRLRWENDWLQNEYCVDCRFCCGPQDSSLPFPMALSSSQVRNNAAARFHLLDCRTACLTTAGCKSDGPNGCTLDLPDKPLACGLFPIVLANGGLYLYQNCPAVVFTPLIRFLDIARKAAQRLEALTLDELRHISLWLTADKLAAGYIDLHIGIFDATRKNLVFK